MENEFSICHVCHFKFHISDFEHLMLPAACCLLPAACLLPNCSLPVTVSG
jgi:hypothetical protein